MKMDNPNEAFRALADAVIVFDRIRLRSWDSSDLTVSQLRLLALLRDYDGLSNVEVARLLNVQPSTVSRLCDRLVERDYVARLPDPRDARGIRLVVTMEGMLAIRAIQADARELLGDVFARMKPEALSMLIKGLHAFRDSAAAHEVSLWWEDIPAKGHHPPRRASIISDASRKTTTLRQTRGG